MRALLIAGVAAAVLAAGPAAEACGDKFVRVGRGGRFQRGYVSIHPSVVLVYVNPAAAGAAALRRLPATLKSAGHKAIAAEGLTAFGEALRLGRYDLVLAEVADLAALEPALQASSPRPTVVPVLRRPAPGEVQALSKSHGRVIEDPDKKYDVLVGLDEILGARK